MFLMNTTTKAPSAGQPTIWSTYGRRQGGLLREGKMPHYILLRQPWNAAPALKKLLNGGGGGGLRHIPPPQFNIME